MLRGQTRSLLCLTIWISFLTNFRKKLLQAFGYTTLEVGHNGLSLNLLKSKYNITPLSKHSLASHWILRACTCPWNPEWWAREQQRWARTGEERGVGGKPGKETHAVLTVCEILHSHSHCHFAEQLTLDVKNVFWNAGGYGYNKMLVVTILTLNAKTM